MASPPRWTKTTFLSWFEQQHPQLLDLTARLFGAELKTCGLFEEDALHTALVRSLRLRHYQRCGTKMRTWFVKDIEWAVHDALREAARTVLLDADHAPDDSTGGDDVGQIEYATSDEVDDIPAARMWCDELPSFIKPSDVDAAKAWADHQLELRHRVARRRSDRQSGANTFWPTCRVGGLLAILAARRRHHFGEPGVPYGHDGWEDQGQIRLRAPQIEAADIENTILGGLVRCTGRGHRQPPELTPSLLFTH